MDSPSRKRKMDDPASPLHPTRRSLIRLQLENTSLNTDVVALRAKLASLETALGSKTAEASRLGREHAEISRAWLDVVQGEETVRKEVDAERERWVKGEREWMARVKRAEEERYALQTRLEGLLRDQERERGEARSKEEVMRARLEDLSRQVETTTALQTTIRQLEQSLESKDRQLTDVRALLDTQNAQPSPLRTELKHQSTLLATLEKSNVALQRENAALRLRRDNVESLEMEVQALARRAQMAEERAAAVTSQLDSSLRELDQLTMSVPPSAAEGETISLSDALSLRHKYTTLASTHAACPARIAQLAATNAELSVRLAHVSRESAGRIGELEGRVEEVRREARWASGEREAVERKLRVAREELEVLRRGTDGGGELERQVAGYRRIIDAFQRDEVALADERGLVRKTEVEAIQKRQEDLESELSAAKTTLADQTEQINTLSRDLAHAHLRLSAGEYNPALWRCVELSSNPAARDQAVRRETLDKLRAENGALVGRIRELERVGAGGPGPGAGVGMVPRETYERLRDEFEEKERAHEKRLQRLKEIFGLKSKEFLEAVFSLLGWRIKFDANGTDVRLSSMYAPRGKHGLTLKFSSQGGHFGTMQMLGGMAKALGDVRVYWVEQRQSIPGFLAQVTLEMFEKTTFGRAAGFVPQDEEEE